MPSPVTSNSDLAAEPPRVATAAATDCVGIGRGAAGHVPGATRVVSGAFARFSLAGDGNAAGALFGMYALAVPARCVLSLAGVVVVLRFLLTESVSERCPTM